MQYLYKRTAPLWISLVPLFATPPSADTGEETKRGNDVGLPAGGEAGYDEVNGEDADQLIAFMEWCHHTANQLRLPLGMVRDQLFALSEGIHPWVEIGASRPGAAAAQLSRIGRAQNDPTRLLNVVWPRAMSFYHAALSWTGPPFLANRCFAPDLHPSSHAEVPSQARGAEAEWLQALDYMRLRYVDGFPVARILDSFAASAIRPYPSSDPAAATSENPLFRVTHSGRVEFHPTVPWSVRDRAARQHAREIVHTWDGWFVRSSLASRTLHSALETFRATLHKMLFAHVAAEKAAFGIPDLARTFTVISARPPRSSADHPPPHHHMEFVEESISPPDNVWEHRWFPESDPEVRPDVNRGGDPFHGDGMTHTSSRSLRGHKAGDDLEKRTRVGDLNSVLQYVTEWEAVHLRVVQRCLDAWQRAESGGEGGDERVEGMDSSPDEIFDSPFREDALIRDFLTRVFYASTAASSAGRGHVRSMSVESATTAEEFPQPPSVVRFFLDDQGVAAKRNRLLALYGKQNASVVERMLRLPVHMLDVRALVEDIEREAESAKLMLESWRRWDAREWIRNMIVSPSSVSV